MTELRARRKPDGTLVVDGVPQILAEVVRELPGRLGTEQPDVVKRHCAGF